MQASAINTGSASVSIFDRLFGSRASKRFFLSQDGEVLSHGSSRYLFAGFCDDDDFSSVTGCPAHLGRKIGFVKGSDDYTVRQIIADKGIYIFLAGSFSSEVFKLTK